MHFLLPFTHGKWMKKTHELTACVLKTQGRKSNKRYAIMKVCMSLVQKLVSRSLKSVPVTLYLTVSESSACFWSQEKWETLQVLSCPSQFQAVLGKPVASLGLSICEASYVPAGVPSAPLLQTPTVCHCELSPERTEQNFPETETEAEVGRWCCEIPPLQPRRRCEVNALPSRDATLTLLNILY